MLICKIKTFCVEGGIYKKKDRERKKNERMKVGKKERTKARNWEIYKESLRARN